jgi:hypothetical protein
MHAYYVGGGYAKESQEDRLMADAGHPFAEDYRVLLADWLSLRWLTDSTTKVVAFKDYSNRATWERPGLDVTFDPTGQLERFWHAYPGTAPDLHREYIAACIAAGWPQECEPTLDCGSLCVHTEDYRLAAALLVAAKGHVHIKREKVGRYDEGPQVECWEVRAYKWDGILGGEMLATLRAVRRFMCRHVPAPVTEADAAADAVPLGLAAKRFTIANVRTLTVTDHEVKVPLVPVSGAGDALMRETLDGLLDLCEQGYPWSPDVRRWASNWLTPRGRNSLDRRFRHTRTEQERDDDVRNDSSRRRTPGVPPSLR